MTYIQFGPIKVDRKEKDKNYPYVSNRPTYIN